MDISNCFYIVPCDDSAVKQYIANNYSIIDGQNKTFADTLGVEFFDKLFDTYIRIPALEEFARDNFIEEQLKQISIYDELKDNIKEIKQILYFGYKGATPRQIKKFINDFSTYYLLAKTIDNKKQFLLKNIPFFAVMLVIKQKWNILENELIQVPNLYDYNIRKNENFKDYNEFIKKVAPLIPQPQPSLLPFIYLKNTTNEQVINNQLRNGELIENIDEKIYKRIKTEVNNIIKNKDKLFILYSANSILKTIVQNKNINNSLYIDLAITLGKLISEMQEINDFASFISNNKDSIETIYRNICNMYRDEKNSCKYLILSYLQSSQEEYKEHQNTIFSLMINDEKQLFSNEEISSIFTNITDLPKITNNIQNYIQILCENNKEELIPKSIIDILINPISTSGIPKQTQNCFKYFSAEKLPVETRQILARKTNELTNHLNNRLQYASAETNNLIADVISCLKLLYKTDFAQDIYSTFINVLYSLLERLRIANDVSRRDAAYTLVVEMFWFIDSDKKFSDELRKFISNDTERLISKIKNVSFSYFEQLCGNKETQKAMLENSSISLSIYKEFLSEIPQKYMSFLRIDGDINNLKLLLDVIRDNNVQIEKTKFRDDIVQKYINMNNVSLTVDVFNLLNDYDYDITQKQKLNIKNAIIDFYKEQPNKGIVSIGKLKNLLSDEDFNENILNPLLQYLSSKIEATESIKNYGNIVQIVNELYLKNNTKLINNLILFLLGDHQDKEEYGLALDLIKLMKKSNINIDNYKEKLVEIKTIFEDTKLKDIYNNIFSEESPEEQSLKN